MMAAVSAAVNGAEVVLFEKNDRVGKKILMTGNGKCNFSNRDFCMDYYHGAQSEKLGKIFSGFTVEDTVSFFEKAGMLVKEKNGYLYPFSEQASTVLDIFRLLLRQYKVELRLSADVESLKKKGKFFVLQAAGKKWEFDSVVVACGGAAAPKTGSDGNGYMLAERLGHSLVKRVPALVQLKCRDDFFKTLAGVRCDAFLSLTDKNRVIQEERGELQFTDYGISGIPVFQLSRSAAYLLDERKELCVYLDFFPEYNRQDYEALCLERIKTRKGKSVEEFLLGMANKKINMVLIKQAGLRPSEDVLQMDERKLFLLLTSYRRLCVHVTGTNSFDQAQVTAGGVDMDEVDSSMESMLVPELYFAGEVLDVDGRCGGYNLQWAWTSGFLAGKNAAGQGGRK